MKKMYKVWLVFKLIVLTFTLGFYAHFATDVLFGRKGGLELNMSDVHSSELKLALVLYAIMCTIEAVILWREGLKDEMLFEVYDYYKDDIDVSDYSPESLGDALTFDYKKEEPKLIKKALANKYIKLTAALFFLIIGVRLMFVTGPSIEEGLPVGFYRSFGLFKFFFIFLTALMVLDYGIKIMRINWILKKKKQA